MACQLYRSKAIFKKKLMKKRIKILFHLCFYVHEKLLRRHTGDVFFSVFLINLWLSKQDKEIDFF